MIINSLFLFIQGPPPPPPPGLPIDNNLTVLLIVGLSYGVYLIIKRNGVYKQRNKY